MSVCVNVTLLVACYSVVRARLRLPLLLLLSHLLSLSLFLSFITRSLVRLRVWLDSLTVVTRVLVLICLAFFSSHLSLNEKAKAIEIQGQG